LSRAFGFVVELDGELAPSQVDLVVAGCAVHDRHAELSERLRFELAAEQGMARGVCQFGGAPRAAPLCRERSEVIEGDESRRGCFLGEAVDRPAGRGKVQERLGRRRRREALRRDTSIVFLTWIVSRSSPRRLRGTQTSITSRGCSHP